MNTSHRRITQDAIGFVLAALDAGEDCDFVAPEGMSSAAVYVPERGAIVAQTSTAAPIFRAGVEATARWYAADVVLLRTGDARDGSACVTADIALAAPPCAVWTEHDLTLWTDGDATWLVPETFGPAVEVSGDGFSVALLPPYQTLDERRTGIDRAARAIAGGLQLVEA